MTFDPQSSAIARLALHQSQRCQAIPTLSVLRGNVIAARQVWTLWSDQTHRRTGIGVYTSVAALLETWLTAMTLHGRPSSITHHDDLRSRILKKVATLVSQSEAELTDWLANTSDYQHQLFWQQLSLLSEDVDRLRSLLDCLPASLGRFQPKGYLSQWLGTEDWFAVLPNFAVIARLFPPDAVPGLLVLLPEDDDQVMDATLITMLVHLVEVVPQIPVGLALTVAQGQRLLDKMPESRTKAMLRGGQIDLPVPDLGNIRQWVSDRGSDDKQVAPLLHLAKTYGATPDILDTALTLLDSSQQPETAEAEAVYRSQAEWFLFQYLEAKPTTMGRFQVNARLDIDFGGRPMEVDFLDSDAKIVIELDGSYYHLQSLDNYRRDRRKDRLLQQHGFLVLRFLSEDVVRDLEDILDAVDQFLATRSPAISHP